MKMTNTREKLTIAAFERKHVTNELYEMNWGLNVVNEWIEMNVMED